jgi:acyl-CoA dehydrogenase
MPYRAPVDEFRFLFEHVIGYEEVAGTVSFADAGPETVDAVLTGALIAGRLDRPR